LSKLTHFDDRGGAHMVDVGTKADTRRVAVATGTIRMRPETVDLIRNGTAQKGDVLGVAQVAGIMAAKNTPQIIPMCHPLMLTGTDITFDVRDNAIGISATVRTTGKTGVEMEALTAVSAAALTIYDMVKAVDRGMVIENIQVESKEGGASGSWTRDGAGDLTCDDGICSIGPEDAGEPVDLGAISGIRVTEIPTPPEETNTNS
jgi:cyclic pyranopterin phosphate synthase